MPFGSPVEKGDYNPKLQPCVASFKEQGYRKIYRKILLALLKLQSRFERSGENPVDFPVPVFLDPCRPFTAKGVSQPQGPNCSCQQGASEAPRHSSALFLGPYEKRESRILVEFAKWLLLEVGSLLRVSL